MSIALIIQGYGNVSPWSIEIFSLFGQIITSCEIIMIYVILVFNGFKLCINPKCNEGSILISMGLFYCSMTIVNLLTEKTIIINLIHTLFFMSILTIKDKETICAIKQILMSTIMVVCIGSMFALIQGTGVQENYRGVFYPFLQVRLYGITPHANSLGLLSCVLVIYSIVNKRHILCIIGFVTVFAAQSKTALISLLVCLAMYLNSYFTKKNDRVKKLWYCSLVLITIMGLPTLIGMLLDIDYTFTGRTNIWLYGFKQWSSSIKSMLLGAGEFLYYRGTGVTALHHAHNQFIHTLTSSGIISFVFLLTFCCSLFRASWKNRKNNYISLLLVIVFLIRCLTETPIRTVSFNYDGVVILLILTSLISPNGRDIK